MTRPPTHLLPLLLALCLAPGCTDTDIQTQPTGGGTGTSGADSTGSSSASGSESSATSGADTTSGDGGSSSGGAPECEMLVLWDCNLKAYVEYVNPNDPTDVRLAADPTEQEEIRCVAPGDVAQSGAFDVTSIYACGAMGGTPPADHCDYKCESLLPTNLIKDDKIWVDLDNDTEMDEPEELFLGSVVCYQHDETDPWVQAGLTIGTCRSANDPPATESSGHCNGDDCEGLMNMSCGDYPGHGATVVAIRGNEVFSELDRGWVDDVIRPNTGLLWTCDSGRYSFFNDMFGLLAPDSLLHDLGVQNGDSDLQLWEHDPATHNRVGSVYIIEDFTDAVDAFDNLIPAAGNDIHITLGLTRNSTAIQIHVDAI